MLPNNSPWIAQLKRTRPVEPLTHDVSTDVVIVGGGIAGVATAYFTLRDTDHDVLLIEGDKVAHGASGHNAGQLATYFERSFESLVEEFGLERATEGQRMVEDAWELLDQIITETQLQTPVYVFTGYAGYTTLPQVLEHLEESYLRRVGGLSVERLVVAEDWDERKEIPARYDGLYEYAPRTDVLDLLETKRSEYVAVSASKKGCANSALLCEEIVGYMLASFGGRFTLREQTMVRSIELYAAGALVHAGGREVMCHRVILATNGFENFTIHNHAGHDVDTAFHHLVRGRIGYMAAYLEKSADEPVAISYYPLSVHRTDDPTGEPYFYLTRRPHEHTGAEAHTLICAGGPDKVLPNAAEYSRGHGCDVEMRESIDAFLSTAYRPHPGHTVSYAYCWHGLMGYTPNRIRRVGVEPHNAVLLYNLGCNGVGLLPSIMGGARIARILRGEALEPSMFDPVRAENA